MEKEQVQIEDDFFQLIYGMFIGTWLMIIYIVVDIITVMVSI